MIYCQLKCLMMIKLSCIRPKNSWPQLATFHQQQQQHHSTIMDIGEIQIGWWNMVCWVQAKRSSTDIRDSWIHTPSPPVPMHHYWWPFSNIISYTSWLPVISHLHEKCSLLGLSSSQVPTTRFLIKKMVSIYVYEKGLSTWKGLYSGPFP